MQNKPLLITTGEPVGIGMDVVLLLAEAGKLQDFERPIWITADAKAMQARADDLIAAGILTSCPSWQTIDLQQDAVQENPEQKNPEQQGMEQQGMEMLETLSSLAPMEDQAFMVLNTSCGAPVVAGQIDINNAPMVAEQLQIAHNLAANNTVAAIVTGPLQKSALIDADIKLLDGTMFSGHTEFFMQQSGCDKVVMMLANQKMKVALVTTHLALKDVPAAITRENVRQTVQIVLDDMRAKFGLEQPRILVCGLNPHAGEGGHLGLEEREIINPVLQEFIAKGVDISEAMPADTLFTTRHLSTCDAVIAMYHDQGLPVLKSHGFGDTVNLTLGLPYIRTSVDHGTALDLAGRGGASTTSLYQALLMANEMANKVTAPS
ncbi:4-hydroxythreonine-4-phosphate dehydrogenase PdxA [Psychrobacter jeotgali]|uniref:4-hydroxythreonine-4-phosphate dehydrogenase PdxA n=1 Tax=Psychrobacter jeotgali TaxID=179010 RepID=UPI001919A9EA|nr:4-hydroxythreonine-4-phosphate dehydrogenase PdxA [Psychrobacter jeotgali]